jgi:hypothetical protein
MKSLKNLVLSFGFAICGVSLAAPALAITPKEECEYVRRDFNRYLPKGVNFEGSSPVPASERYITGCILVGGGNAVPDAIRAARTFPRTGAVIPLGNNDCIYYGFSISIISKTGIYTGTDSCAARS